MRVNGNSPIDAAAVVAAARSRAPAGAAGAAGGGDSLQISTRARDVELARDAIRNLPEVRQERIDSLRDEIRAGRYRVPAEAVAASMMDSFRE